MGTVNHHVLIGTTDDEAKIDAIKLWLIHWPYEPGWRPADLVRVIRSPIEGYIHVIMAPDGSKEGWEHSEIGDKLRDGLIAEFKRYNMRYVEVQYGELGYAICRADQPSPEAAASARIKMLEDEIMVLRDVLRTKA